MICYRDRTYCSAYRETCTNDQCNRAVTYAVERDAKRLGLPIAFSDLSEGCPSQIKPVTK